MIRAVDEIAAATCSIREAMALLEVSRTVIKGMIARGDIGAFRLGGRTRILRSSLTRWLPSVLLAKHEAEHAARIAAAQTAGLTAAAR